MRAMVIDDSRAMRAILRSALVKEGFEVIAEVANGKQALEALRASDKLDLVLVDWNMPEMSGIEIIGIVRAERSFSLTKLMMVTTETEPSHIRRALDAGADEYIMKPFTRDALQTKLTLLGLRDG